MLVSGNILSSAENEERIRCHFQGKQYLGWKAVRDKLKELKERFGNNPPRYVSCRVCTLCSGVCSVVCEVTEVPE